MSEPPGALCVLDTRPRHEDYPLAAFIALAGQASRAIADINRDEALS